MPPEDPNEPIPSNPTKVIPPSPLVDSKVYKRVFDSDEVDSMSNILYNEDEYRYEVTYNIGEGLKDMYSIQLEDTINKSLKVFKVELEGNHLGQDNKVIEFIDDDKTLQRVYNESSNKVAYRFPKVNDSYEYLENKVYKLNIYVKYVKEYTDMDNNGDIIENTAYMVNIPEKPNNPDNPDPNNPNNPNDPDPKNPPTLLYPDPNPPTDPKNPPPEIPSEPVTTIVIPPPPKVTTDVTLRIKVTKQWQDENGNNLDNDIAAEKQITVGLFVGEDKEPKFIENIIGNGEVQFKDVPAYYNNTGKEEDQIVYTIKEVNISDGYSPSDEGKLIRHFDSNDKDQNQGRIHEYIINFTNRKNTPPIPVPKPPEKPTPTPPNIPIYEEPTSTPSEPETPKPEIPNKTPKNVPKEGKIPNKPNGVPSIKIPPDNGKIIVNTEGIWKYTPNKDYVGKDRFVVTVKYPDGTIEDVIVEVDVDETPLSIVQNTLPKTGFDYNDYYVLLLLVSSLYFIMKKRKDEN